MDLPGEAYLFNLSLVAMTFAAVSVLVMLMRQTVGETLSNYDIHLVTNYVSQGFVVAVGALLPSMLSDLGLPAPEIWNDRQQPTRDSTRSMQGVAHKATSPGHHPSATAVSDVSVRIQWMLVVVLVANAIVPSLRGVGSFWALLSQNRKQTTQLTRDSRRGRVVPVLAQCT